MEPSQDWLDGQMVSNIGKVVARYYLKQEGEHLSRSESQARLQKLEPAHRVQLILQNIEKDHYPASEIEPEKLSRYIDLYLNDN